MKKIVPAIWIVILSLHFCCGLCFAQKSKNAPNRYAKAEEVIYLFTNEHFKDVADLFDGTANGAASEADLKAAWEKVIGAYGSFKGINQIKEVDKNVFKAHCRFEKDQLVIITAFNEKGKLVAFLLQPADDPRPWEAPSYANLSEFSEREVKFGSEEWELPGTLTLPKVKGKCPVVVLVHGSGPQDRDESIGPNKIFKDLAWGLASQGIGVLRYEKRTLYYSLKVASQINKVTLETETVDDAVEAVKFLKTVPEVDPNAIYVLGHSLGGMAVPLIAEKDGGRSAGFIIMAGSVKPLEDLILEQVTYIFNLDGKITDEEQAELDKIKQQVAAVKNPNLSPDFPASGLPLEVPAPYWIYLKNYHIAEEASKIKKPVLCLQGARDYQVTPDNLDLWKDALRGNKKASFVLFPGLNHLFITGQGPCKPEEIMAQGHVDENVVKTIIRWVKKKGVN
ncbi:MAG: DUF3887 domain-containing protein [Firmicutes bacterium]|nr:DUF3887 domain-containing protein [Bacillota bacterium]